MNVSSLLRIAQTTVTTSLVSAVAVSCVVSAHVDASATTDHRSTTVEARKEYRVAPTRKEYRVAPVRKEYRVAPVRKEYGVAPVRKEYRVAPVRKEYRVAPTRQPFALVSVEASPALSTNQYAAKVLHFVNVARGRHHLPELAGVGCASRRATRWSQHLAATGSFTHQSMKKLMRVCHADYAGETLARGSVGPRALVRMWLDSAPHRAILLSRSARQVGIGATPDPQGRWVVTGDFVRL